jgi:large subunit ribosomal protein L1
MKRSKNYRQVKEKVDHLKLYPLDEAVRFIKDNNFARFDESVDINLKLGVDPRHADQIVRGTVSLARRRKRRKRLEPIGSAPMI